MERLVFVVSIFCLLPAVTAIRCYVCENDDPLCHDAFERSSGFEQNCSAEQEVCVKKIAHGSTFTQYGYHKIKINK